MIWTALSSLISSSQGFAIYDVSTSSSFPIYEGKIANADITNGSPLDLGKGMVQEVDRLDHLWNHATLFDTVNQVLDRLFSQSTPDSYYTSASPLFYRLDSDDDLNNVLATKQYDHFFSPLFHVATVGTGESLPFRNNNDERNKKATSYRLDIRYRGDAFCGWQRQNHSSLPAVQQVLEDWLQALQPDHGGCRKKPVDVRVCGRTDAGVHALSQVCRFRTSDKGLSEDIPAMHTRHKSIF
jgi:tRNA pseudouridine38-40 synthase